MLKLNGLPVSGAKAKIRVGDFLCNTVQGINYSETMEPTPITAMGSTLPISATEGELSTTGDLELLLQEMNLLRKALAAQAGPGNGYQSVEFDVVIHFDNGVDEPCEVKLVKCRLTSQEDGHAKGPDALKTKAKLYISWIERDGLTMVGSKAFEGLI